MGQFIEVLNNQANLDDLNLNLESFQGGLDCNVDEVSFTDFLLIMSPSLIHQSIIRECLSLFFLPQMYQKK
jgi:hypothetical protein